MVKREFIGDNPYQVGWHQQFVNREGKLCTVTKDGLQKTERTGEAYAFFDSDASKQELDEAMPQIREKARTPEGLQLLLHEGTSGLQLEETLAEQIKYPDDYRAMSSERIRKLYIDEKKPLSAMKYALVARYEGASNERTASELGDVLNVIHRRFDRNQDIFTGAIAYKKDGEYVLKE